MKSNFFFSIVILFIFFTNVVFAGRCTGKSNCKACTTCSSCKYCNSGGNCGVCGGGSGGGSFGNLILLGGGIVFILWLFSDNSNKKKK